jgi:prepilin-type N-terminal cleavage/methylation domain-containing protein
MNRDSHGTGGFTLLELLVVMGIIAVLVAMLLPTLAAAMMIANKTATRNQMNELSLSLKAFRTDFGDYPPSRPYNAADPASGALGTGPANLVYYLGGPAGSGWGTGAAGRMPFPGQKPLRQYGPYADTSPDGISSVTVGTTTVPVGYMDHFHPAGIILYIKCDNSVATGRYLVSDGGPGDATAKTNYMDQAKLEEVARFQVGAVLKWVSQDFILVSPGPDGRYGYIRVKKDTGQVFPCSMNDADPSNEYTSPSCDDLSSWN